MTILLIFSTILLKTINFLVICYLLAKTSMLESFPNFSGVAGENTCLLFYYENLIKSSHLAVSQKFWSKDLPVKMDIIAFFPIPKQLKKLLPTSSPDLDNVAKSVCDVLNIFINFLNRQI